MEKHTHGPWIVREMVSGHFEVVSDDSTDVIVRVPATTCDHSNARLIAAAPDLLAALQELVAEFDGDSARDAQKPGHGGLNETGGIVLARAAIAKAIS